MNVSIGRSRPDDAHAGARALAASALAAVLLLPTAACTPPADRAEEEAAVDSAALASADVLLSEVTGPQFTRLTLEQRWRAVASLGTGLPPTNISRTGLPEAEGTGAGLLEVYCTQCHWLPTPQMHSSEEWDILLRRMLLRARLLDARLEGEHVPENLTVTGRYRLVPTVEHLDSLRAYLKRNALPVVDPASLPETEAAGLYVERCAACHQTPAPDAHVASEWDRVVDRMQTNMKLMQVDTLTRAERDEIMAFLEEEAPGS